MVCGPLCPICIHFVRCDTRRGRTATITKYYAEYEYLYTNHCSGVAGRGVPPWAAQWGPCERKNPVRIFVEEVGELTQSFIAPQTSYSWWQGDSMPIPINPTPVLGLSTSPRF